MALLQVPYNNAMRLGQGFNSYTQEICVDNAVVGISDNEDSQPIEGLQTLPLLGSGEPPKGTTVVTAPKEPIETVINRNLKTATNTYPSQIVTYYSKFVDKISEISNNMNVSGSMSIKYGEVSGGGSGSFVDVNTFQSSDMNFFISVKVINQTINVKDQPQFWPLDTDIKRTMAPADVTKRYGDSFISGFQEGGSFYAVVSIRSLDSAKKSDIAASAHLALQVGVGSVDAEGSVALAKQDLQKNSEVSITVNWSGGGQLKEGGEIWNIDTLTEVAVRFPDLVAQCPQRTHAILTKYTALRGYLEWQGENTPMPLDYELASLYTSDLLDVYMGYKVIWTTIHTMMDNMDGGTKYLKAPNPSTEVRMPSVQGSNDAWQQGEALTSFEPSFVGLELALGICRNLMIRIVGEVDQVTKQPAIAVNPNRPNAYLRPQLFKQLLPVVDITPIPPGPVQVVTRSISLSFGPLDATANPPVLSQDLPMAFPRQLVAPSIATGFSRIHLSRPYGLRLKTYAKDIGLDSATITTTVSQDGCINASAPPKAKENASVVTALTIGANDDLVQCGIYALQWQHWPTMRPPIDRSSTVKFDLVYDVAPSVVVWLSSFDRYENSGVDICVIAENVTTQGFDLRFHSREELYSATANWIAVPSDRKGIACGNTPPVSTDVRAGVQNQSLSGHIMFPPVCFSAPPTVLVAISGFYFLENADYRLDVSAGQVTKASFNWSAKTWDDTPMADAAVGWIAIAL